MKHQVFSEELVAQVVSELNIANLGQATIGEILLVEIGRASCRERV